MVSVSASHGSLFHEYNLVLICVGELLSMERKMKKKAGAKLGGAQVLAEVGYNLNSMIIYMLFHMNLNKKII